MLLTIPDLEEEEEEQIIAILNKYEQTSISGIVKLLQDEDASIVGMEVFISICSSLGTNSPFTTVLTRIRGGRSVY